MRIKLDENIPFSLVASLKKLGHDIDTVQQEGLAGRDDQTDWQCAQDERRFFITQDLHFADIRTLKSPAHEGLLLLRLRDSGRLAMTEKVRFLFETEPVVEWKGCLVVASERKLRILRPV